MNTLITAARLDDFELDERDDLGLEERIEYIEGLMRWYSSKPSTFMANVIVSNLETLRLLEQDGEILAPEWSCQRLIGHWEYILRQGRARRSK